MSNNTNNNVEIVSINETESVTSYKWTVGEFLTTSNTYGVIESAKYFANKGWDYLLEFSKFFLESQYIEKSSGMSFIVNATVNKLHQLGDNNINTTIDFIVTKIDNYINPKIIENKEEGFLVPEEVVLSGSVIESEL